MSQSATLYRMTPPNFQLIEKMEVSQVKPSQLSEGHVTFQGSFMALEAILSKGLDEGARELVSEIFNPTHYIGPTDANIFNFGGDDEEAFWEQENAVGYLAPNRVKKINALLSSLQQSQVAQHYDAEELNADGIYPGCWQNDDAPGTAFNKRQILEDFQQLVEFFEAAAKADHYVLSYVGGEQ